MLKIQMDNRGESKRAVTLIFTENKSKKRREEIVLVKRREKLKRSGEIEMEGDANGEGLEKKN